MDARAWLVHLTWVGGHGARRLIAYQRPDRKICYVRLPACVQKPSPAAAVPFKLARQRAPRRERAARRQAPVSEHVSRRRPFSLNPSGGTSATRAGCGTRFALLGGASQSSAAYEPRLSSQNVVYQVVRDHFEALRAQAAGLRDGEGLPRFVEEEFRAFLRCGFLALRPGSGPSRAKSRDGWRVCAFSL